MGRRKIQVTKDEIVHAIKGVEKAGIEVKTVRIEPNGAVVINGDNGDLDPKSLENEENWHL